MPIPHEKRPLVVRAAQTGLLLLVTQSRFFLESKDSITSSILSVPRGHICSWYARNSRSDRMQTTGLAVLPCMAMVSHEKSVLQFTHLNAVNSASQIFSAWKGWKLAMQKYLLRQNTYETRLWCVSGMTELFCLASPATQCVTVTLFSFDKLPPTAVWWFSRSWSLAGPGTRLANASLPQQSRQCRHFVAPSGCCACRHRRKPLWKFGWWWCIIFSAILIDK